MRFRRKPSPRSVPIRRPKTKRCQHFEAVADAAQRVVSGELPPSRQAATTLAEEYLLLHLEFQALMTHLEDR